ncbi:putative receptor-like protein 12-like [Capsicum annuum]|nr:putative receptor-like protein 12-like [Capsicum annuum]
MMMVSKILFSLLQFFTLFTITFASTEEATALLKWKATFKNQNNSLLVSWKPSPDACNDWYGVVCFNGRVNRLNIRNASVFGTLYAFPFSSLPFLKYVDLSMNNHSGTIPPEIGNLTNLIYLNLSVNQISGTIPPQIGSLARIQAFHIFENHLNGSILEEIGYLRITDMKHNNLSGTLPTTFSIGSALRSFNLHRNKLEGKIPQFLENCQRLEVLDLGDNLLNDTFPMWLGTLPELRVLSLRLNKLHGPIRTSGSEHMFLELRIFDLSRNDFSKNLPMSLFQHLKAIRTIDQTSKEPRYLGDSYYHDSVMVSSKGLELELLQILTIYTTIDLSNNKFEGYIPSIMGDLIALRVLNLSHNGLQGHIPPSFFS